MGDSNMKTETLYFSYKIHNKSKVRKLIVNNLNCPLVNITKDNSEIFKNEDMNISLNGGVIIVLLLNKEMKAKVEETLR